MAKQTKPILDTKTGTEYPSMYAAGVALGKKIVPNYTGEDRLIWFSMVRAFPGRFQTKSTTGAWVALDDPSVPKITRVKRTETIDQKEQRLLAELGAIQAARKALEGTTEGAALSAAAKPKKSTAAAAPAAAAATATAEVEEVEEEVEEEAASPTPGSKKLGEAVSG